MALGRASLLVPLLWVPVLIFPCVVVAAGDADEGDSGLAEVVVTAQKREENLREVFSCASRRAARRTSATPPPPGAVKWREYAVLLRTPSYVFCTLGMAAMTFAIGGIAFWMPYYLGTRAGARRSSTIIFGAITALAGLIATLLGGVAGDRLRARFPGSYFLVSGTAMLAGFPCFSPACGRRSRGLAAYLPHLLLPVLQHRPDQHDPGQRDASLDARRRLCAQHLRHPRARRRHLAGRHRHRQRPIQHEPGFPVVGAMFLEPGCCGCPSGASLTPSLRKNSTMNARASASVRKR